MERVKRARILMTRAKDAVERRGEQPETVQMLQEAIDLLHEYEVDASRFRDLLSPKMRGMMPA